jgi:uncharacterized membrane protein (GlpM family)
VTILLVKLLLAPACVVAVSLAARHWGPRIGGVLGGLPVVAGPILFVLALDHGVEFGADAAANTLAALVALTAFVVAVAHLSARFGALASVMLGWLVFLAVAAVLGAIDVPPAVGLPLTFGVFALAGFALPRPDPNEPPGFPSRPPHDLLIRALVAAGLVLVITTASASLGANFSGVLAPFPTITSVLVGFSIAHDPRPMTMQLLRGMFRGFFSFAVFCFTVAVTLEPWGTAPSFLAAIAATAAVQLAILWAQGRGEPAPALVAAAKSEG